MEQHFGYVAQGDNIVCKLRKGIYSLKQSLRVWFDKFNHIVSEVGFQKCYPDNFVFIRRIFSDTVILADYIDDILLTKSDNDGKS